MVSYWGHFSEPGYLRPGARCASPDSQAQFHNPAALKAGSGNRRGKVQGTLRCKQSLLSYGMCASQPAGRGVTG